MTSPDKLVGGVYAMDNDIDIDDIDDIDLIDLNDNDIYDLITLESEGF